MSLLIGSGAPTQIMVGKARAESMWLGDTEVWRAARSWQKVTMPTTITWPAWARFADIIILGAGGGGSGGSDSNANGAGGSGGTWTSRCGMDTAPGSQILLTPGTGGPGGAGGRNAPGGAGGASSVSIAGTVIATAPGGAGGTGTGGAGGTSPGRLTFTVPDGYGAPDTTAFDGGSDQAAAQAAGNAPGGGGGPGKGAFLLGSKAGGDGADGAIWIRLRSW